MPIEIGLVGAPNPGKSTFFKAATLIDVEIAAYPFTTIKPNTGMAYATTVCPCKEFKVKCKPQNSLCIDGTRLVPIKLWDVAGLVPGAHQGKGLGNQFLNDLRQAQALIHVLDASGKTDSEGKPAENHNPADTVKFLENEIDLWFIDIFQREWKVLARKAETEKQDLIDSLLKRFSGIAITREHIKEAILENKLDVDSPTTWSESDIKKFCSALRRISKPMVVAANKVDMPSSAANYEKLKTAFPNLKIVPCASEAEVALRKGSQLGILKYVPGGNDFEISQQDKLTAEQKKGLDYIRENVFKRYGSTGVQQCLNTTVFDLLDYIVVYPVEDENKLCSKRGNILPDAFLLKKGATAKDFAFSIHSDIGRGFITAIDCRTKRRVGADYQLKNGDVISIVSAAR